MHRHDPDAPPSQLCGHDGLLLRPGARGGGGVCGSSGRIDLYSETIESQPVDYTRMRVVILNQCVRLSRVMALSAPAMAPAVTQRTTANAPRGAQSARLLTNHLDRPHKIVVCMQTGRPSNNRDHSACQVLVPGVTVQ